MKFKLLEKKVINGEIGKNHCSVLCLNQHSQSFILPINVKMATIFYGI